MMNEEFVLPETCTLDARRLHNLLRHRNPAAGSLRWMGTMLSARIRSGNRADIAVELVAPVRVGEVLLTHGGVAIGRVLEREVERSEVR